MRFERYYWKIRNRIERYVFGEKWAARLRLFFVVSLTALLIVAGYVFFEDIDSRELARTWRATAHPLLDTVPLFVIQIGYIIGYGFRHAVIPLAIVVGAFIAAASYVQDIYELPNLKTAIRYLFPALFGFFYPRLRIEDGKKQIKKGDVNPLDVIGGPGYINIRPGNAVLFESLRSPSSVKSEGYHFITRFDTIREIVSLEDQHGFIEETKAVTKDGIEVILRDVHYRYRLRTGREFGDYAERKPTDPYPYSVQAVKNMAYNRTVRSTGLNSWFFTINFAIDSAITGYIKSHQFDHLTHPNYQQGDPREIIARALMGIGTRARLRRVGADLLWCDIGHFRVSDEVLDIPQDEDQPLKLNELIRLRRVETWGAKWMGQAEILRSYGKARQLSNQDLGRAEGQAEMLRSIMQAMEEADLTRDPKHPQKNLRAIILARTAEILDSLATKSRREGDKGNP
jgi:hypothetical protein